MMFKALVIAAMLAASASAQAEETITVSIARAELCVKNQCYPALVGKRTPRGSFSVFHARIEAPGYGGDVLAFTPSNYVQNSYVSIHRVWTRIPGERRIDRLYGPVEGRVNITNGCINVMPDVYNMLVDCCSNAKLVVD